MAQADAEFTFLKDYRPTDFAIPETELKFDIRAGGTVVKARMHIVPQPMRKSGTPLRLDGADLTLVSVAVDGALLGVEGYDVDAHGLSVHAVPDVPFVLETHVEIDPAHNTKLMGLYRSSGVWCTQCEPEGFRRITYFLDRPDVLSVYTVRIEADAKQAPVLLSNGNKIEQGDLGDGRHYAVWHDPFPKPTYLFALVAGDLGHIEDSFTTVSGRKIALGIYCEHGKQSQCAYAMDSLKRSMAWDEKRFGREYDLDLFNIVAVSDFNFGAMENKGLNIFNDRFVLADPAVATDADYANIERIIAHEYFHNWTGNRITCRDWFQLCLKEGLTVYRDQEFTSDERSRAVKRIEDVRGLRAAQFPEDAGPLAHPARPESFREIENFYTATVYVKGAEIVSMLANLLGTERFRKGTDLYFERHDGEATTIEAWLKVFEDATGEDLGQFGKWYGQAGTPEVRVDDAYDAKSQTYRLTLTQTTKPTPGQTEKSPMVLPVKFGLVGPNGHDLDWSSVSGGKVTGDMIVVESEKTELVFKGISARPVPSLFRAFSAPVKLTSNASETDRLFLARHDSDPFNRWQALQDVGLSLLTEAARNGGKLSGDAAVSGLIAALADTLADANLDDAFKALAMTLPGETWIAQALGTNVDPTAVHLARNGLVAQVGRALGPQLHDAYRQLGRLCLPYSLDAAAGQARSLRNQCLALLAAGGDADAAELVSVQYKSADNMTDQMAALGIAVFSALPIAPSLMADFHDAHGSNPLLFDKWLTLVAASPEETCLGQVKAAFDAPDFPKTNPNRVRSLIGSFASGNPAQFSRADGEGFRFVAGVCAEVDPANPQLAARLLTAFRSFRTLEPARQRIARSVLEDLRDENDLSRNLSDILGRTLAG